MDHIPGTMIMIGAGVVGCEYACIFVSLGVKVTLLDSLPTGLDFPDHEIKQTLPNRTRTSGVIFRLGEKVESVTITSPNRVEAHCLSGKVVAAQSALQAIGCVGNTHQLSLDNLGLEANHRGLLSLNHDFQTAMPHVYAAGDVRVSQARLRRPCTKAVWPLPTPSSRVQRATRNRVPTLQRRPSPTKFIPCPRCPRSAHQSKRGPKSAFHMKSYMPFIERPRAQIMGDME